MRCKRPRKTIAVHCSQTCCCRRRLIGLAILLGTISFSYSFDTCVELRNVGFLRAYLKLYDWRKYKFIGVVMTRRVFASFLRAIVHRWFSCFVFVYTSWPCAIVSIAHAHLLKIFSSPWVDMWRAGAPSDDPHCIGSVQNSQKSRPRGLWSSTNSRVHMEISVEMKSFMFGFAPRVVGPEVHSMHLLRTSSTVHQCSPSHKANYRWRKSPVGLTTETQRGPTWTNNAWQNRHGTVDPLAFYNCRSYQQRPIVSASWYLTLYNTILDSQC